MISALATTELTVNLPGLSPIALEELAQSNNFLFVNIVSIEGGIISYHIVFYCIQFEKIHIMGR